MKNVFTVIAILIGLTVVSVACAIIFKMYSILPELSVVFFIVAAVSGAVAIGVVVFMFIILFKKK